MNKKLFILFLLLIFVAWLIFVMNENSKTVEKITNFDECIAAGNPAMESYPRQCMANGETFIENIGNELDKIDLIRLNNPRPNQIITSPLPIEGQARGTWFFEGDFPVVLTDWDGRIIAESFATAQGDWMSEEFVQFKGTLEFEKPDFRDNGLLILRKDNPSGLPENDDALEVPVLIGDKKAVKNSVFECTEEQREADACIQIFDPVCAEIDVRCITSPCPPVMQTYSNSCEACMNSLAKSYTMGECQDE